MNFDKLDIPQEEIGRTEKAGLRYITININDNHYKIRETIVPYRLKDDGETHEEYKHRRQIANSYIKEAKKGKTVWLSKLWGMKTPAKEEAIKNHYNNED